MWDEFFNNSIEFNILIFVLALFGFIGSIGTLYWIIRKIRLCCVGRYAKKKYYQELKEIETEKNSGTTLADLEYIEKDLEKTPSGYYQDINELENVIFKVVNRMDVVVSDLKTEVGTKWNGVNELYLLVKRLDDDIEITRKAYDIIVKTIKETTQFNTLNEFLTVIVPSLLNLNC